MGALLEPFFYIIALVVDIYFKVVVVEVVLHWLIHFKILEADNKYAKRPWKFWKRLPNRYMPKSAAKFRLFPVLTFPPLFFCLFSFSSGDWFIGCPKWSCKKIRLTAD